MSRHARRQPAGVVAEALTFLALNLAGTGPALRRVAGYALLEGLPTLCSGLLVAAAVDRGFLVGRPLTGVAWLAALGLVWGVGAAGTRAVYPWLAGTVEPLRDALLTRLVAASLRSAVQDGEPGRGASVAQATVQVETARALFASLLRTLRQLLTTGLAALAGLSLLAPPVAAAVGSCVLLATALFGVLLRVLVRRHRAVVLAEEAITARAAPVVTGVRDVVAAGAQDQARREVGREVDAAARAVRAAARARVWRLPLVTLGAHVPLLALLAGSPALLAAHRLTVGDVVGGVVYLTTGLEPAVQLLVNAAGTVIVNLAVVLTRLSVTCAGTPGAAAAAGLTAGVGAVAGTLPGDPSADRPATVPGRRTGRLPQGYRIDLDAVTFRYAPQAAPVIHELSLHVPQGGHLAVVGPSGAGKSTLTGLLTGLLAPQRGTVLLGGVPVAELDPGELHRLVALIPQEAYVFTGTVRENLAYLRPDAPDAELLAAVRAVGADPLVHRLGGLDAGIDPDAGGLTPGASQLIALARVHLSRARIVILDEASCHLDPDAEARVEAAFAERGGTLVVIAHRMSSALRADRVLVLGGVDTDLGQHEELLARNPLYGDLVGYWAARPGSTARALPGVLRDGSVPGDGAVPGNGGVPGNDAVPRGSGGPGDGRPPAYPQ